MPLVETIDDLRNAGLASIFPQDDVSAGPVTHLLRGDGTQLPVTARLQSISWNGRPALMLSASATEVRTGHEAARCSSRFRCAPARPLPYPPSRAG